MESHAINFYFLFHVLLIHSRKKTMNLITQCVPDKTDTFATRTKNMIKPIPFRAFRPIKSKADQVVSRSYISYSASELNERIKENPYSFIHIVNPEFSENPVDASPERFKAVKQKFQNFIDRGLYVQDGTPCFYLYQQIAIDATYTGIICAVSTDDYRKGRIKVHEETLDTRVRRIKNHLYYSKFNAEPVLLTYREHLAELQSYFTAKMPEPPEYDFTTSDGISHRLWKIDTPHEIKLISKQLERIKSLYIADGHHRMKSSLEMADQRRAENPNYTGREKYNRTLAMIMSGGNLRILPFHRLLKTGFDVSDDALLRQLDVNFIVKPDDGDVLPPYSRTYGLRLKKGWFTLELKEGYKGQTAVDRLDASILNQLVLNPIFGLNEAKRSGLVRYIAGNEDLEPYEKAIDNGTCKALFTLHEVAPEHVFEVAEAGEIMPAKTTYILPKMRSGLTVMPLE